MTTRVAYALTAFGVGVPKREPLPFRRPEPKVLVPTLKDRAHLVELLNKLPRPSVVKLAEDYLSFVIRVAK
jgi:hypothetical protein